MKLRPLAIAPYVLLIAGAVLYTRDIVQSRRRQAAAEEVRQAAPGTSRVYIVCKVEESPVSLFRICTQDLATNLLTAIYSAEPMRYPKGGAEGEEFWLWLEQTNGVRRTLRGVRLASDPDNVCLGVMRPEVGTEAEPKASWVLSPPAHVLGIGQAIGEQLDGIRNEDAKKLPPLEKLKELASTNRVSIVPVPTPAEKAPSPEAPAAE